MRRQNVTLRREINKEGAPEKQTSAYRSRRITSRMNPHALGVCIILFVTVSSCIAYSIMQTTRPPPLLEQQQSSPITQTEPQTEPHTEVTTPATHTTTSTIEGAKEILLLNVTDASALKRIESDLNHKSPFKIDILIVGSQFKTKAAQAQFNTWASHKAVRHFFMATEFDDADPTCYKTMTDAMIKDHVLNKCKRARYWEETNLLSNLTEYFTSNYARLQWLEKKKSPSGWLCAQRRFGVTLTKVVELYAETLSLPDYFIIADDDTYINIDHIVELMMRGPQRRAGEVDQLNAEFPTQDTPVVYAGCRVRAPDYKIKWTFPFGGFGTFFSKGSLQRLIQPLHCNGTDAGFEPEACLGLEPKTNNNWAIGEKEYFKLGDSINQMMYKYIRNVETYCLHSDWLVGYLVNFYNISRHVVTNGMRFDDPGTDPEMRLHSFMGSEIYRNGQGNCANSGKCEANATVCHYVKETGMQMNHLAAQKLLNIKNE